jgi:hypothetical protein
MWGEWDGDGYEPTVEGVTVYITSEHPDIHHPLVSRALASALQRDGLTRGLGHGMRVVQDGVTVQGFVGNVLDETTLTLCNHAGVTPLGDILENVVPMTWVELHIDD